MLHHYNYSTSLSHFLSYHRFDDSATNDADQTSTCGEDERKSGGHNPQSKSFTIAAILGLKGDHHTHHPHHAHHPDGDVSVVNLSVHQGGNSAMGSAGGGGGGGRLQLPSVRPPVAVAGHFAAAVAHPHRHAVRGLKHLGGGGVAGKKACKSKRVRTIFTPEQLERLEAEFERQQYMVGPERLYLAHTLQLTEAQVKVWFQNRRIKWRKHHLELTHQRLAVLKQQQILMEEAHLPDVHDANSSGSEA